MLSAPEWPERGEEGEIAGAAPGDIEMVEMTSFQSSVQPELGTKGEGPPELPKLSQLSRIEEEEEHQQQITVAEIHRLQ